MVEAALGDPTRSGGVSDGKSTVIRAVLQACQRLTEAVDD
jgi:hypothetical protein